MLRVLLIDDNDQRAGEVIAGLRADGCEVVRLADAATDLVGAVRAAAADVIVCDSDAPSRDALESMRALHRDEPRPVVMFVDRSDAASIAAAMEAGVAAYVIEGPSPARVRGVIAVAVARFRAHQAVRAELAEVRAALSERKAIERAKGILMATRHVSEDEAFRGLRRLAMDQGKKLAAVAESIISVESLLRGQKKDKI